MLHFRAQPTAFIADDQGGLIFLIISIFSLFDFTDSQRLGAN